MIVFTCCAGLLLLVPVAASVEALPYDRWSELGADAVMIGSARAAQNGLTVEIRVIGVRGMSQR